MIVASWAEPWFDDAAVNTVFTILEKCDVKKERNDNLVHFIKLKKKLEELIPEIQNTSKLVQEITAASMEQNAGAEQVNNAIQQLNTVTQQNAASSEEMATSSEELSTTAEEMAASSEELVNQADQLKETISFFKIDSNDYYQSSLRRNMKIIKVQQ